MIRKMLDGRHKFSTSQQYHEMVPGEVVCDLCRRFPWKDNGQLIKDCCGSGLPTK